MKATSNTSTDFEAPDKQLDRIRGESWGIVQQEVMRLKPIRCLGQLTRQQSMADCLCLYESPTNEDRLEGHLPLCAAQSGITFPILVITAKRVLSSTECTQAFTGFHYRLLESLRDTNIKLSKPRATPNSQFPYWTEAAQSVVGAWYDCLIDCMDSDSWTDEKNSRRCYLVDKKIDDSLSDSEESELEELQREMLSFRRKRAPLPLDEVRALHQELLKKQTLQDG